MKMKKIIIISIVLILFVSGIGYSFAFVDINSDDWFYEDVSRLNDWGIIDGFIDGTFKPDDTVNVDQFIKLIITSLGYNLENGETYWASPFILEANKLNIVEIDTFDDYRRPITRGEMAKIIVKALNKNYSNEIFEYSFYMNDYFLNENEDVLKAYYLGIITGYPNGSFYSDKLATRVEASVMLIRMLIENRRVKTDTLNDKKNHFLETKDYYLELIEKNIDKYNLGFSYEPYVFENGDMMYTNDDKSFGAYLWDDGDLYIGDIINDEFNNEGVIIWNTDEIFAGQFIDGIREGEGISVVENSIYSGNFVNDEILGFGITEWDNGDIYIGQSMGGIRNGLGKIENADGSYYIGNFVNDNKNGKGIFVYSDGLTHFGEFKENEMIRKDFTMYYKNSTTNEFELKIDEIFDEVIKHEMTTNEKIKALHDYLILNVMYDVENYDNGTISDKSYSAYGALIDGVTVCSGYSDAFNLLLNKININSNIVEGEANDDGHAWNYVEFEEGYYYVDVTWDDNDDGKLRYDYFKKSLAEMNEDHVMEILIE
jgi:hypothetical protein